MKLTSDIIQSWKNNVLRPISSVMDNQAPNTGNGKDNITQPSNKVGTIRRQCTKRWQSIEVRWWDSNANKWTSRHWTIESAWKQVLGQTVSTKQKGGKRTKVSNIHRNRKAKKQDRGSSIIQALKPRLQSTLGLPKRWWVRRDGIGTSRNHIVWELKRLGIQVVGISDVTKEAHNGCRAKKARRV